MTDVYQFGAQPSFAAPANDAPYYVSNAPASASGSWADTLAGVGWFASLSGTMLSAVGSFYAAQTAKNQAKSQALSAEFAQNMANIEARSAESDAQAIIESGQREKAALTLQHGYDRAAVQIQQAKSGTAAGVGSNAEVLASQRLMQRIDAMTMDSNTIRAANAARTRGVNARNEGLLAGVSAQNLRAGARTIDPYAAGATSLLGSAGTLASQWLYRERGTRGSR